MRFRQQQDQARAATRALLLLFALTVLFTVLAVNAALALVWRSQFGLLPLPNWFFETNTLVTLGFVLGGCWLESRQLRDGGEHVARMVGGREVVAPQSPAERRLRNIVDEMAIASGLKAPRVFVLDGENSINALAAGWEQQDSVVAVTRGAMERLTRDELQGVVAHEFAHILNGDTRLNMRLIGMVFGLQLIFNFGRGMLSVSDRGRRNPLVLVGLALMLVGSIGWLAGRVLKAGVSRQREYLADAFAVQFTREPTGLGNALRKVAGQLQRGQHIGHVNAEVLSHLLLSSDTLLLARWLATHPPIEERVRRLFGHDEKPLADDPVPLAADPPAPPLAPLDFFAEPSAVAGLAPLAVASASAAAVAQGAIAAAALAAPESPLLALPGNAGPAQLHAAVLACLVPGRSDSRAELVAWRQAVGAAADAPRLLAAVQALPVRQRQPWFERLLGYAAAMPRDRRAVLLRDAVAVVRADGRLSLYEYLQARVLQRQLAARAEHPAIERRALRPSDLGGPIATVTGAVASLLPQAQARAWSHAVLAGLGLPPPREEAPAPGALNAAIDRLGLLGRVHRPALVKQWLESGRGHAVPQAMADVLRCVCLLIDTPLPPELARKFDALPALPETPAPLPPFVAAMR